MRKIILLFITLTLASSCSDENDQKTTSTALKHPNQSKEYTYQLNQVTISDPYHWLENSEDETRNQWIKQQQVAANNYFSKILPEEPVITTKEEQPSLDFHILFAKRLEHKLYYLKQEPLIQKFSIVRWNLESNQPEMSQELNISGKEPVASSLSPGARYYAILWQIPGGSDERSIARFQWQLFDLANNEFTQHEFPVTAIKTNIHWLNHNRALLLSNANQIIRQPLIPDSDKTQVVFDIDKFVDNSSNWYINVQVATDKTALVIKAINPSQEKQKVWVKDLDLNPSLDSTLLLESTGRNYKFVGSHGDRFYFKTTLAAARGRIISINRSNPSRQSWKEVISEQDNVLLDAILINNEWLLHYVNNTKHLWFASRLNGSALTQIEMPEHIATRVEQILPGSGFKVLLSRSSLSTMRELYVLDFLKREVTHLHSGRQKLGQLNSKVFFYRSSDGSRIPVTIYSKGKVSKSENNRILVTTHQGLGEHFSNSYHYVYQQWLEHGGIIAVPHIRGGGTYGKAWQKATTSDKQLKAAEDLNASVEWLLDKNYSSKPYVTGFGINNSATYLLQAMMLSPDNWQALVLQNPTSDFMQYYKNTDQPWLNHLDIDSSSEGIKKLLAMSPYHNFPQAQYPALLVVDANQSNQQLKLTALLQNMQLNEHPVILIRAIGNLVQTETLKWPVDDLIYRFLTNEASLNTIQPLNKKALN